MRNKNILITGGLGFIGSHIANTLIENNNITIIDNLSTGNIKNLNNPQHENLKIIKENICNTNFNKLTLNTDYIFHLASMASVPLSVENPITCSKINLNATIKLLKSAADNNVEKIIFSSSSAVYGENKNMPLKETETLMPNSPYASSKASCELYLKSFYECYGLNYTALRYFNVFGPKQNKNSQYAAVIPNFINALLKSDYNGVVNVACGEKLSINKLYEIIKQILGSDIEPEYRKVRPGDIKHSLADVNNMKKINYKVTHENFEKQLKETINWFKKELK
ncbi:GDP-mannose 4,6-dehydratase [uncultured Methanobrevibacter sp.]|uniref:GDP-mannose 4,6-dehydratase n=1 Tax=uncultured Methanobrevibacter sp. TaxID=253161 RepID=UPI0025F1F64A|nr:NAD-dependent epimerase/dehydratase family protein [uncultured Methanobrevibacter sp.]